MVISQPARRYDNSVQMIPELLDLGRKLYTQLEALSESVVILISADLAHTHEATGPYGFSKAAEPFDRNIGNWAATLHPSYLLEQAALYANDAKSCGFTGLVMLHGILEAGQLSSWIPVMHANFHPSYYGMMVASFSRDAPPNNIDQPRFEDSNFAPQSHGDNVLCPNCTPRRLNNRVAP
uniref:Extradiol ring-cleavage dioxygenase class III enzyme subunit B domain-containing protein n=1 Tax=Plectus sambesii TaxID=2011161 RepID=A0A914VJL3_9BILA